MAARLLMPIGSCRVHDALKRARDDLGASIGVAAQYGLIYNSKEIIQQIRNMRGELAIPRHVGVFLAAHNDAWRRPGAGLAADTYLVEISAPKILAWDGFYLQQNGVNTFLRAAGAPTLWPIIWHDPWDDAEAVRERMRAEADYDELPSDWQDFLMSMTMTLQTPDDLAADVDVIEGLLGRGHVVFLAKATGVGRDGVMAEQRLRFAEALRVAAEAVGAPFFDPTAMMVAFGQDRAFDGGAGGRFDHYSRDFEAKLVDHLMAEHLG